MKPIFVVLVVLVFVIFFIRNNDCPVITENLVENFDEKSSEIGRIWKNCDSLDGYKDDRWCNIPTEYSQPSWFNIRKDFPFIGGKFDTFNGVSTKQVLINAQRNNDGSLITIPNKLVRISNTNDVDSDYCSGNGIFKQTCYQSDGKTLVDCESNDAAYRLKEGTCNCDTGYGGNQCQFTCNGHGDLSVTKDKTDALQGPIGTFTCDCSPSKYYYTSRADGQTKAYVGDQCQYSDNDNCRGKGYVTSTGTCSSCNLRTNGADCSGNVCKNGGIPSQDGKSCICQFAWDDNGLCETSQCRNGTYPTLDGSACTCKDYSKSTKIEEARNDYVCCSKAPDCDCTGAVFKNEDENIYQTGHYKINNMEERRKIFVNDGECIMSYGYCIGAKPKII